MPPVDLRAVCLVRAIVICCCKRGGRIVRGSSACRLRAPTTHAGHNRRRIRPLAAAKGNVINRLRTLGRLCAARKRLQPPYQRHRRPQLDSHLTGSQQPVAAADTLEAQTPTPPQSGAQAVSRRLGALCRRCRASSPHANWVQGDNKLTRLDSPETRCSAAHSGAKMGRALRLAHLMW